MFRRNFLKLFGFGVGAAAVSPKEWIEAETTKVPLKFVEPDEVDQKQIDKAFNCIQPFSGIMYRSDYTSMSG
jgi:hypothetical protein